MRCAIKERQQKEEEAGKANRELVTAMSHDLRTPLTSLLGYVDILQMEKGEDRGQQRKYLNSIRDKAYQIKELSDKLFEYFIVYGRKREELEAEEVNGAEFLGQIVEESLFDMESEGFDIRRSSDEINCRLLADINLCRRGIRKYIFQSAQIRRQEPPGNRILSAAGGLSYHLFWQLCGRGRAGKGEHRNRP